ncbi:response regulator [Pseudoduganella violaceinigra]|uniref:response regulator n=1 Tax=Pseudoduganella violaceinigra TaxID=246602 RepID=UPI0004141D17|nr:response regulator [Pseudoduganella violaceinigra]
MENIVLLVDDDREIVDLLSALFLQHGWMPQRANSGAEALACVRRSIPQAVVCDLSMPGMSGFDVAAQLRHDYGEKCPPLIAFTTYSESDIADYAKEAGFNAVVSKPSEFSRLLSVVDAHTL